MQKQIGKLACNLLVVLLVSQVALAIDCGSAPDKTMLEALKVQSEPVGLACFSDLLLGNSFESAVFAVDSFSDTSEIDKAIDALRQASQQVQHKYNEIIMKIEE